jgi:uncharacterized protein involved in exopolysaccharide biosynthesis
VRLSVSELDPSPSLLASAWRFRLLVCTLVVAGAAAGFGFSALRPVTYESTAQVLIQNSGGGDKATRQMANQIAVMGSQPALARAAKLYGHNLTADGLRERVSLQAAEAADLVLITATADVPNDAARLADSVVQAYVATLTDTNQTRDRSHAETIGTTEAALEAQLQRLRDEQRRASDDPLVQIEADAVAGQLQELVRERVDLETSSVDENSGVQALGSAVLPTHPAGPGRMTIVAVASFIGFVAAVVLSWWLAGLRRDGRPLRPWWAGRTDGQRARQPGELLPVGEIKHVR